jgi:hypothetical protein
MMAIKEKKVIVAPMAIKVMMDRKVIKEIVVMMAPPDLKAILALKVIKAIKEILVPKGTNENLDSQVTLEMIITINKG